MFSTYISIYIIYFVSSKTPFSLDTVVLYFCLDSEEIVISGSIITSKRVGIEGAGKEWAQLPLR